VLVALLAASGASAYYLGGAAVRLGATWGLGEAGAAGPVNPYGDPADHGSAAVAGPMDATRHLPTGDGDLEKNMMAFAAHALDLLAETVAAAPG
jgi:hypothetical protein